MDEVGLVKAPRICHMERSENGYGFNLHGEKGVVGQYISAVDTGGTADQSGLCVGDRVVEVNGINVEAMSHSQVVDQIRSDPTQTTLLVVDKITDNYLKKINRPITASLANYSSVHEIKISDTENLAALGICKPDEFDGESYDHLENTPEVTQELEVNKKESDEGKSEKESTQEIPKENIKISPTSLPPAPQSPSPPPAPPSPPPAPPSPSPSPPIITSVPPDTPPYRKESNSMKFEDSNNTGNGIQENGSINESEKIINTLSELKIQQNEGKNEPDPVPLIEKKTTASFKKTPKRKEVKQTSTDWKSKLNMFDNL